MSLIKFGFKAQQIIDEGRVNEKDIELVKNWMFNQNFPKLTDEQIVLFLLSCYNETEDTKTTIKTFFNIKNGAPDVFNNRKIERVELQKHLKSIQYCISPVRTEMGCTVLFARLYDTHYSNFELASAMKLLFMTLDAAIYDHPPKGMVIVYDMTGFGLMHLTKLRIDLVKTYFRYLQEALPVRLLQVHVLNTAYFIDKLMAIMSPFLRKDVMDRLHFHPTTIDMNTFYEKWVPKRCLPEELGGDLPPIRVLHQKNIEKLKQMEPYFEAEERQRRSII